MRLVNRLEQWTLYPMIFLWVASFIVGFYDVYLYLTVVFWLMIDDLSSRHGQLLLGK